MRTAVLDPERPGCDGGRRCLTAFPGLLSDTLGRGPSPAHCLCGLATVPCPGGQMGPRPSRPCSCSLLFELAWAVFALALYVCPTLWSHLMSKCVKHTSSSGGDSCAHPGFCARPVASTLLRPRAFTPAAPRTGNQPPPTAAGAWAQDPDCQRNRGSRSLVVQRRCVGLDLQLPLSARKAFLLDCQDRARGSHAKGLGLPWPTLCPITAGGLRGPQAHPQHSGRCLCLSSMLLYRNFCTQLH